MMGPGFADHLFFSLLMGFWALVFAFVCVLIFKKALDGDITFSQAILIAIPLIVCYLLIWAGQGGVISWLSGGAALGYLTWIAVNNFREERKAETDLLAADIEKWSRAIAEDEHNSGAHLFLGHTLVKKGEYEAAAAEYSRAIEMDAGNVRGVVAYLATLSNYQADEIRSRIPNLDEIARAVRDRGGVAPPVAWEKGAKVIAPEVTARDAAVYGAGAYVRDQGVIPGTLGVVEGGVGMVPEPEKPPSSRELLGYSSEEERIAEETLYGRLGELRDVVANNPDDVGCRLAYARALEEVGQPERARAEYARVLDLQADQAEAQAALGRLAAPMPPVVETEPEALNLPEETPSEEPGAAPLPPLILGSPDLQQGARG